MFNDINYWSNLAWSQIWQIGLLGVVVTLINQSVGRRWPHLAYALWLVVLVKCFVPPIGPSGLIARLTPAAWFGAGWAAPFSTAAQADVAEVPPASRRANNHEGGRRPTAPADGAAQVALTSDGVITANAHAVRIIPLGAVVVWLAGGVLLLGIAIGRGKEAGGRLRRTSYVPSDELLSIAERIARQLGLKQRYQLLITASNAGPMVAGLWTPRVYLPEALLERLSAAELEAMLTHELAHVRRRDTWVAACQFAAQTVWWFHPVVWWMNRELIRQRERCCDEEVIACLDGKRTSYAHCLVRVLETRHTLEPLWGYPAVRPVELTRRRLEEIMKRTNMVHRRAPLWSFMVAAAVAVVALPGASDRAIAQQPAKSATPAAPPNQPAPATPGARPNATAKAPDVVKYDDNKPDGKKSLGGSGEMIRFELPQGVNAVAGVRIHGSRYGLPQAPKEDFEIIFVSEDFDEVLKIEKAPYELFRRSQEQLWVRVPFKEPVSLPKKFWVVLDFHAEQTKGVYVSYDTSTKGQYSRIGLPGDEKKPRETDFGGDWMIQLLLATPPAAGGATKSDKMPIAITLERGASGELVIYRNEQKLTTDELKSEFKNAPPSPGQIVSLGAEKGIQYGEVVTFMDLLNDLGIKKISLDTRH